MKAALLCIALLAAPNPGASFDAAFQAQRQGRHAQAAAAYEALVRGGAASPELFHNLGVAYAALGRRGEAMVQFMRALRLDPALRPARVNLARCAQTLQAERGQGTAGNAEPYLLLERTQNGQVLLPEAALALWAAGWGNLLWRLWRKKDGWPLVGMALVLAGGALAGAHWLSRDSASEAVVVAAEVPVRYGTNPQEPVAFVATEGTPVAIEETAGAWVRIRTLAGSRGWAASDAVLPVGPPYELAKRDAP